MNRADGRFPAPESTRGSVPSVGHASHHPGACDNAVYHFNGNAIVPLVRCVLFDLLNSYHAEVKIESVSKLDGLLDP